MPNLITVTCQNCGREFQAKACRLNTKYGVKYCSPECYRDYYRKLGKFPWQKPKVKLTCKKCGKTFEVKPSEAGRSPKGYCRKYCSLECALTDIIGPEKAVIELKRRSKKYVKDLNFIRRLLLSKRRC
jgi:hypothetical protein